MVAHPLSVGGGDVSNLFLKFSYGATLKGRILFEGSTPPRPQVFRVLVETGEPGALAPPRGTLAAAGLSRAWRPAMLL